MLEHADQYYFHLPHAKFHKDACVEAIWWAPPGGCGVCCEDAECTQRRLPLATREGEFAGATGLGQEWE